jgi:hypothetical protein
VQAFQYGVLSQTSKWSLRCKDATFSTSQCKSPLLVLRVLLHNKTPGAVITPSPSSQRNRVENEEEIDHEENENENEIENGTSKLMTKEELNIIMRITR